MLKPITDPWCLLKTSCPGSAAGARGEATIKARSCCSGLDVWRWSFFRSIQCALKSSEILKSFEQLNSDIRWWCHVPSQGEDATDACWDRTSTVAAIAVQLLGSPIYIPWNDYKTNNALGVLEWLNFDEFWNLHAPTVLESHRNIQSTVFELKCMHLAAVNHARRQRTAPERLMMNTSCPGTVPSTQATFFWLISSRDSPVPTCSNKAWVNRDWPWLAKVERTTCCITCSS